MEKVCFSFASQRQHFIVPDTVGALTNSMNLVLRIDPSECHFIKCEEVASNWFNLMFELPNRREVVDKLCLNALEKEPWLAQCGVRAVKIVTSLRSICRHLLHVLFRHPLQKLMF